MLFRSKRTGNPRFAYDSYRRFIQMFSDVVMEVPKSLFERVIDEIKEDRKVHFDTELTAEDLKEVIRRFKEIYKEKMGEEFPQEPRVQLMEAVKAVFRSWDNERAIVYRFETTMAAAPASTAFSAPRTVMIPLRIMGICA